MVKVKRIILCPVVGTGLILILSKWLWNNWFLRGIPLMTEHKCWIEMKKSIPLQSQSSQRTHEQLLEILKSAIKKYMLQVWKHT